MANDHMKKCSLVIREIPIHSEMSIHYISFRMTRKKMTTVNGGEDLEN